MFGKKPSLPNCDWCGTDFEGAGVELDGLVYCSDACIEAKNAPVVERQARSVHAAKKMTIEDAREALGIDAAVVADEA